MSNFDGKVNQVILSTDKGRKSEKNVVIVSDKKEFEILLYMLEGNVYFDESSKSAEIKRWKQEISDINKIKLSFLDKSKILLALGKIYPEENDLNKRETLSIEDLHKTNQEDIMVSKVLSEQTGKISKYVGSPTHTQEIVLDHINSEHVEAILLTEMCRQSAIATVVSEFTNDSQFYISEEFKKYEHLVQQDKEVIIQTFLVHGKGGMIICLFSLFQNDSRCVLGYFLGIQRKER